MNHVFTRIALLDGVKPLHDLVIKKGYKTILITRDINLKSEDANRGYEYIYSLPSSATFEDWYQLLNTINQLYPLSKIISFHDDDQIRAIELSSKFWLESPLKKQGVHAAKDKAVMRELLNNADIDPTKWAIASSYNELSNITKSMTFPLIVKPVDGVASRDVYLVNDNVELRDLESKIKWNDSNQYIAEEYHDGQEYSVEGFSIEGRHYFLGVGIAPAKPDHLSPVRNP